MPTREIWEELVPVKFCNKNPKLLAKNAPIEDQRIAASEFVETLTAETINWSDGSKQEGYYNGGGGAIILHRSGDKWNIRPAGRYCSSTRAELVAILVSLEEVQNTPSKALLCNSMAALQIVAKGTNKQSYKIGLQIWNELTRLQREGSSVCMYWFPRHVGIEGKETADRLANQASELAQDN